MSYRTFLIVSLLMLPLFGCDAPVEKFESNDVYALTLVRSRNVPTDAARDDAAEVVRQLFGTPDQPRWPTEWMDEDSAVALIDPDRLVRAAGPVSSERDGTHLGLFREHCVTCHGLSGNGAGPASSTQNPYPRDFRPGVFKWKSTERAEKPTRADLTTLLQRGVPGTGMPSFSLLVEDDLEALVDYTVYLSVRGEVERRLVAAAIDQLGYEESAPDAEARLSTESGSEGAEVVRAVLNRVTGDWSAPIEAAVPEDWRALEGESMTASIARGEEIFHGPIANCVGCHGKSGKGDVVTLDFDDWTKEYSTRLGLTPDDREAMRPFRQAGALRPRPVQPRNLQDGVFRGGDAPETLYRRITQGIAGTPMPAVPVVDQADGTGLTSDQVWDLVRYLRWLGEQT